MKCKTCGNEKTLLLYSTVCDHCEKEASLGPLLRDAIKRLSASFKEASIPKKIVTRKPLDMPTGRLLTMRPAGIEPPHLPLMDYTKLGRKLFPVEPLPEGAKQLFYNADFAEAETHVLANMSDDDLDD